MLHLGSCPVPHTQGTFISLRWLSLNNCGLTSQFVSQKTVLCPMFPKSCSLQLLTAYISVRGSMFISSWYPCMFSLKKNRLCDQASILEVLIGAIQWLNESSMYDVRLVGVDPLDVQSRSSVQAVCRHPRMWVQSCHIFWFLNRSRTSGY